MPRQSWRFDLTHSSIGFRVRHLMVSTVHGRFGEWSGSLEFDEQRPQDARLEVRIDAASIDTREPQRDEHLRSADFLDVAHHPHITFRSTSVEPAGEGRLAVLGELTLRGATRPVRLDVDYAGRVQDPWGGERAGFSARASISRKDFGLTWNQVLEAGGVTVGDKVLIDLEVEAIRQVVAPAREASPSPAQLG